MEVRHWVRTVRLTAWPFDRGWMSRNASNLSLSASLKEGMSPLTILQKMQESSVAILVIEEDVNDRREDGRNEVWRAVSLTIEEVEGLRRYDSVVATDMQESMNRELVPNARCK